MRFTVKRRSKLLGVQERWLEIDIVRRVLKYYDNDPNSTSSTATTPHKYAWPFAFVLELEHDTLPTPSPFPSRRPNVTPPELRIMIKDHKSFSVTFVDHDTLSSFVDVCLASNPLTTLLIAGKPQPRKVLTASARGNARASAITTSSSKAAPFPMARASAIVTGTTPNKGVGSLANGAGGFSLSREANNNQVQPSSLKRTSMVPKFVQERRDEEAKAQARDRLHARWNAAPVADAAAAKAAAEKALEDKNKKPSGLALALAKQAASNNNSNSSSSSSSSSSTSSSKYATLLAPFSKAIISKILSLKSSASGKPLYLRFLKLNQLLLLIVEAPDPHPSTTAQLEKGYALVRDFEELIREEYAMGSEKRARDRETRLMDPASKGKIPEEEADEQTLSRSLQNILQLLFDLLALRMGDIEFTPVIKEKVQQAQGDELSFLRELRDASAKLLREQAGAVFGVDRSKISHKSGSIISISSSAGGSSILRDAISSSRGGSATGSSNGSGERDSSEDMGLDDKDSPLLQGSTPGTSQVSGVPLSESLLAGESLPSINLLDESHHPSLSLNTSGNSGSSIASRRRSSAHTGAPPVSGKSRGNSLQNIPETMQITVDVSELNVIHEHDEDPLVAASLGSISRRATFDRARNSASSFHHLAPQSHNSGHKGSVSTSEDSLRSRLSSKRLSSRESISLNAVLELDLADEDEVEREKRRMQMLASLDEEDGAAGGSPKPLESDEDLEEEEEEEELPPPPPITTSETAVTTPQPVTVSAVTPAPSTVPTTSTPAITTTSSTPVSSTTEMTTATVQDDFLDDEFAPPVGGRGRAVALIQEAEAPKPVAKPTSTTAAASVSKSATTASTTKPQPTPQQQQQRRASLIARENALQQHRNKLAAKFTAKQNEVQRKWNEFFEKHPSLFATPTYPNLAANASPLTPPPVYTRDSPAGQQLKQLIRMYGIPQRVRGKVWKVLTNLEQLKAVENAAWKQRLQAKSVHNNPATKPASSPASSPPTGSSLLSSLDSAGGFPSMDELKQLLKREKNSDACQNSYYRGLLVRGLDISRNPAGLPPSEKKLIDALQAIERDFAKLHQNAARESGNAHLPPIVPNTNYSLPFLLPSYLTPVTSLMSLHRILIAYALRNPNMGYLQSINQLISLILLVLEVKEDDANASINLNHMPKTNLDENPKQTPQNTRSSASDLVQSPLVAAAAMAEANSSASAQQRADPSAASLQIPLHEEDAFFLLIVLTEEVCAIRMGEGQGPEAERVPHTSPEHPLHASYLSTCAAHDELYPVLFYFNHDLLGLRIDQEVFAALAADKLPKVHNHLTNVLNIPLEPFFFSWFTNLLIQTLPLDLTLRIWDLLFSEGIKVLFRATLTILKMVEETILAVENEADLLVFLRGFIYSSSQLGGSSSHGSNDAHDAFIRTMFNSFGFIGSLSMSRVGFLRKWYRSRLENVTAAYAKGRKAQAGGALARLPSPVRTKKVDTVAPTSADSTATASASATKSGDKKQTQSIPAATTLAAGTTISDEDSEQFWNQLHELEQAKRLSRLQQKSAVGTSIIKNSEEKKVEAASTTSAATGRVRGATFLVAEPVSSVNETVEEEKENSLEPTSSAPAVKVKKLSESSKSIAVALSAMLPVHPPTRRVSIVAGARVHGVAAALLNPRESLRDSILNIASGSLHHGIEEEEEEEDDEEEDEEEEQESRTSGTSVAIHVDASVKDSFAKAETIEASATPSTIEPSSTADTDASAVVSDNESSKPKKKKQYTPEQQAARDAHKAGKAARKAARAEKRAKKAARAAARLAQTDQAAATPLQRDLPATNHPPSGAADSNMVRISVVDLPPANGSGTVQWPSRPIRGPDAALSDPAAVQSRISIAGRASVSSHTSAPNSNKTASTSSGAPTVENVADVTFTLDVPADDNEVLNRFSRLSAVLDTIPADKSKFNACHGCGKEIVETPTERMISAMGFVFHSACFNCSCFGVDPARSCKHANLLGQAYLITEGKLYGEACYRVRFGKSCAICSKEIRDCEISMSTAPATADEGDDGKAVEEEEQLHFHQSCVACLNCHKKAHEAPLFKYDAEKYDAKAMKKTASNSTPEFACESCFIVLTAPKCYACTKPILPTNSDSDNLSGDGVLVQGKQFHSDCVTCAVCKIPFNKIEPTPQVLLSSLQPVEGLPPNAEPPMVLYCGSHTRGKERENCCFSCIEPLLLQSTVAIPITGHNPSETGMRSTTPPKPTTARYHTSCAKCMVCAKTVSTSRECLESAVVARDLFCPAHKHMSPAVCNRCSYVIIEAPVTIPSSSGVGLMAPPLTFHAACLICAHPPCAKNLKGETASDIVFDVITGAPKCKSHFASASTAAPVVPATSTSGSGTGTAPSSPRTPAPMPVLSPRKAAALASSSSPSPTNSPRATTPTPAILSSSPTAVSSIPPSNNILGRAGGFRPPKLNNAPALPSRAPPTKPKVSAPVPIKSPSSPSPVSPRSPAGPSSRAAGAASAAAAIASSEGATGTLSPRSPVSPRSPISPRSPMSPHSPPPPPPMHSPPHSPRSPIPPVAAIVPGTPLVCSVCQSSAPPASLLLGGQMYHGACLKCVSCSSIFKDGVGIYPKDGQFFCRKCFVKQFATCCAKCSKPIESGAVVKIPELNSNGQPNPNGKEQEFHSKCFSCNQCKTNLAGQPFLQHASKGVLCEKCAH